MAELKTKPTKGNVEDFLDSIAPEQKRLDGYVLLQMFKEITGEKPVMWGNSIVGFGKYHYKSERSKQEGDWPLSAFSPRKQSLSLYIMAENEKFKKLLNKLGKHKTGVGCLYINKLSDIDINVLKALIKVSYVHSKRSLT